MNRTDIQFYHLTATPLERALPKLLEKALAGNFRVLVRTRDAALTERLNTVLWTYHPDSFLPHGTKKDGNAERQPIYITHENENPNAANLAVVTDGSLCDDTTGLTRLLDIFDGANDNEVMAARERWAAYKKAGHSLAYIKQNTAGGWDKLKEA